MAQEKELKPQRQAPDPEMLKKFEVLQKMEILQMMREMGIVQKREKPGNGAAAEKK